MTHSIVDFEDTQGLVRYGFGSLKRARYALLRVKEPAAARTWLAAAPITNAVELPEAPATALQVAFTAAGLKALGVPLQVVEGFSQEFLCGMTEPGRSRRLGDVGDDAPSNWHWGRDDATTPHVLAMFFAKGSVELDGFVDRITGPGWTDAFQPLALLETSDLEEHEPFGFKDGISQPEIDWHERYDSSGPHLQYTNNVALGEFLLGYRNEYGRYASRPLVDSDAVSQSLLPAEDVPHRKDVGRNGTYVVMRQLEQDVRAFWQYVVARSGGDFAAADKIAAAMVGRTRDGFPLLPVGRQTVPGVAKNLDQNQFTFEADPAGNACPFGAHIRRSNPRNADYVGRPSWLGRLIAAIGFGADGFRDDLTSAVRFHRILRRGREYGSELSPADALAPAPADEAKRGLHFICLNANISRQFEFIQNAWTMSAKFSALDAENDPVLGNRTAVDGSRIAEFSIPRDGAPRRRIGAMPRFVTVRGGAYFFLPGIRALRYLARAGA
jgi:Dyp-type peroxidase family